MATMKWSSVGLFSTRHFRLLAVASLAMVTYGFMSVLIDEPHESSDWTAVETAATAYMNNHDGRDLESIVPEPFEPQASTESDFGRVANRTLGFEKVMVIGLPERSDKRDAIDLMASLSGFNIDWVEGVKTSSISSKAVPFGIDLSNMKDNFLGSWRGHMNAIRHIVRSGITSALIMEDDIDWDIYLKEQLHDIARGARQIFHETSPLPHSPYGDDWDILWLGHCGEPLPETLEENIGLSPDSKAQLSTKFFIHDDNTVPPYDKVSRLVDWSNYQPRTRIIHLSGAPICSFAYAVSQSGAKKILYNLSVDGLKMAFDNSLAQLCRDAVYELGRGKDEGYRMKCLSVNPTIMFHHKAKGSMASDSDIQSLGEDGSVRDQGVTESVQWSTRLNLKNILTGKKLRAQFQEEI